MENKKTNINELSPSEWVSILKEGSKLKDQCDKYHLFFVEGWLDLLQDTTDFDDIAREYQDGLVALVILRRGLIVPEKFDGFNWLDLLVYCPELAIEARKHNAFEQILTFCIQPPTILLVKQPQFLADLEPLGLWEKFNHPYYWYQLLKYCPEFEAKAKESPEGWVALLVANPDLAPECKIYDSFEERHFGTLLDLRPEFKDICIKVKGDTFYQNALAYGIEETALEQNWI